MLGQISGRQIRGLLASQINNNSGVAGANVDAALDNLDTDISTHISDTANPHAVTAAQVGAIPAAEKGANNGVATLDNNGKIPAGQIPALALERIVVVADAAARFALTLNEVQNGDIVKQTDTLEVFVVSDEEELDSEAGYTLISSSGSAPVDSVFGRIGVVSAAAGDYEASLITNDSGVAGDFVDDALDNLDTDISTHSSDTNNPHSVTAAQVGSYTTAEVDNLLDAKLGVPVYLDLVPSGTVNGSNRDFAIQAGSSSAEANPNTLMVFLNNLYQVPGINYTLESDNTVVRFSEASTPVTNDTVTVRGTVA